jgi:hypothetical protein
MQLALGPRESLAKLTSDRLELDAAFIFSVRLTQGETNKRCKPGARRSKSRRTAQGSATRERLHRRRRNLRRELTEPRLIVRHRILTLIVDADDSCNRLLLQTVYVATVGAHHL